MGSMARYGSNGLARTAMMMMTLLVFVAVTGNVQAEPLVIDCIPDQYRLVDDLIRSSVGYSTMGARDVAISTGGDGAVSIAPDPTGSIEFLGVYPETQTRTYTATDESGTTASCSVILGFEWDGPCPPGSNVCGDPHMAGLRGQKIDWSGDDGGWYCLIKDDTLDLHMNVRVTAPLPEEFPNRQLITGLAILSGGNSYVVEVKHPYSVRTNGCPEEMSPCLSEGGLALSVDGVESAALGHPTRNEPITEGITVSASNLPVECRQFGAGKIWARMYDEMLHGNRELGVQSFEDWVLSFDSMAAPDWCARYISLHGLEEEQSAYSAFKISTSKATIRLHTGISSQGDGDLDWDGRVLPDLDFWQMDVGIDGASFDEETVSGILGETARPMIDENGREIMEGQEAFRGTVEDYRVSGALGTDFALRH